MADNCKVKLEGGTSLVAPCSVKQAALSLKGAQSKASGPIVLLGGDHPNAIAVDARIVRYIEPSN